MSDAPAFLYKNVLTQTNELTSALTAYTTITVDNIDPVACSAIGLIRPQRNGTVTVSHSSDGSTYTEIQTYEITANRAILGIFTAVTARYWKVVFDASTEIAVIKLGEAFRADHNNYGGVAPSSLNQTINRRPGQMSRGQFFGRRAFNRRAMGTFSTDHTTMASVRANALDLINHLRDAGGVFYAWRPESYPGDVVYGFLQGEISPTNTGTRDLMSLSISVEGLSYNDAIDYPKPTSVAPV